MDDSGSGYVVGIDGGDNSVGLAAIDIDAEGMPVGIRHLLVVMHDGGKDPVASGQTGSVSRKASGGRARRLRRLLRNRRKRAAALERELQKRGYILAERDEPTTHGPWEARRRLLAAYIEDDNERSRLLASAIRHMSNHRGWANAWVDLNTYVWKEEPTPEFEEAVAAVLSNDAFGVLTADELRFQADLAVLGIQGTYRMRQRTPVTPHGNLLGVQRRADVVREWRQICRVQGVSDDEFLALATVAFSQAKPKVPQERVGRDWIDGYRDRPRASIASLEHQEFQIRQTVANLSIRSAPRSQTKTKLTVEQQELVVDHLMGVTNKDHAPSWAEIAENVLGVAPMLLVNSESDGAPSGIAPIMRSVAVMHQLKRSHPLLMWWVGAPLPYRSDFIQWFADPTEVPISEEAEQEFSQVMDSLDEAELEAVLKLSFPSGRSAHCIDVLRQLSAEIACTGKTYTEARNALFNGGRHMTPPMLTLDLETEHPTLQRILPPVRRFLGALAEQGMPQRVVLEHVRSAFLGFDAKQEAIREQNANRRARETVAKAIADAGRAGVGEVKDGQIRKHLAIQRQNSTCLYCGQARGWEGFELDHIVPRASGGNSTRANLVAVCVECNRAKGKRPFAIFASSGQRPGVTLEGATERVRSLAPVDARGVALARLKREMTRRLNQADLDDPVDERSLASTAYAAVELRRRIDGSYGREDNSLTQVYSGSIVSLARVVSGIDRRIGVREGLSAKSRFDRRHHAIDAAVAAMLTPSVARTLAERDDLCRAARLTAQAAGTAEDKSWTQYEGHDFPARAAFRHWLQAMDRLNSLIAEAVAADTIVVTQPVRFSANHAALHEEKRSSHHRKPLGEEWSTEERARIVDDRVYSALSEGVSPQASLPADASRSLVLPSGKRLTSQDDVYLFPDLSARIALPNLSSARLGGTIHHVRLFRWEERGKVKSGVIRVWASDLYDLEGGISGDLLTAPLPESSRAVRRAALALREALHRGEAAHVGTFVIGDEVFLSPEEWMNSAPAARFLREFPERRWRISGWEEDGRFNIRPLYLAREGAVRGEPGPVPGDKKLWGVSAAVDDVLERSLRVSATQLWTTPSTLIVRRNAVGRVRSEKTKGIPTTWSPFRAVQGRE